MSTSAVPAVIDALVTATRTSLPSLRVYDGVGISDDPGDWLMIGVDDPDVESRRRTFAATARQEWAHANFTARDEEGDVTCVAMSWNGDADIKAARDAVYATTAAVETVLRANPSLGVPNVLWTSFGPDLDLSQMQGENGASAFVIFTVRFRARL